MVKLKQNVYGKLLNEFVQPQKKYNTLRFVLGVLFFLLLFEFLRRFGSISFLVKPIHAVIVDGIEVETPGE